MLAAEPRRALSGAVDRDDPQVAIPEDDAGRCRVEGRGEEVVDDIGSVPTSEVAGLLGKKPQSLSPARDSLLKKGLIYSGERGRIAFTVPHFGRYLREQG